MIGSPMKSAHWRTLSSSSNDTSATVRASMMNTGSRTVKMVTPKPGGLSWVVSLATWSSRSCGGFDVAQREAYLANTGPAMATVGTAITNP
jgi:hypothetical protein